MPNTYIISSNLTQTSEELKELNYLHKVREVAKRSAGIQIQAIQGQRPGSCSQSQWVLIIEKVLKDNNMAKFVLNWLYFLNKSMLLKKKKKQVLVSICRRMSKASFIFIFKENQQKCWYFLLMSIHHLVHIHTCCIIPTVQIPLSFPGFSVSCSSTHQHLDTDFDTFPPSKSFISWLSLLSNFFHSA